uniref:ATP-dependent Clp protease proteolytic subunit n=1 Tax=Chloropicon laureae TaxID=464258 RepID=A0A7S3E2I6_9CHLO|mmetsp:Transcript_14210/g.36637  ORF Transcript_14210/g.36637 Transcript_14210/m.36637 type:complete len:296 (+) Transcript_14210:73-960(+)
MKACAGRAGCQQRQRGCAGLAAARPAVSGARPRVGGRRQPSLGESGMKLGASQVVHGGANPALAPRTPELSGDPFALLLKQRIVFLGGEVNDFSADAVISQLLLLDSMDPTKDIKLFINSPGGSVTAGLGIYDAMGMCRADVSTVCFGLAASMGAFLLGAGAKGKRLSMPNARIMIHQPLGGAQGAAVDLEIQAKEIMYHKVNLNRIMAECTGKTERQIDLDTDRDRYMSPIEAMEYGIIDEIIGGEEAVSKVQGDTRYFPKTKEEYINWWRDAEGDSGERSSQFSNKPVEPFSP